MDYDLTLKIRNAPMLNLMRKNGFKNVSELSRASGINQSDLGRFLNLKKSAYGYDGYTPLSTVTKLADFLGVNFEELFPEKHLHDPLIKNEFETQVNIHQLEQLSNMATADPMKLLEDMETLSIESMTSKLTERESKLLKYRYDDDLGLEETGKKFDISRERVRQIERKALRKLRILSNIKDSEESDFRERYFNSN